MGVTVHDAANEFLFARATEGLSKETIRCYSESLDRFLLWADQCRPGLRVDDLTAPTFRDYITWLQANPRLKDVTVAKFIRELKVFSLWLESEGHVEVSPFRKGKDGKYRVRVPKFDQKLPEAIDDAIFARLLAACDVKRPIGRRDHAIIRFLYDTGVRVGELCNLMAHDIDIVAGRAKVHGKGRRERVVFFGPETQRSLQRYRTRLVTKMTPRSVSVVKLPSIGRPTAKEFFLSDTLQPLTPGAIGKMLTRVTERAGVKDRVSPHGFRHGFGVGYVMRGGDIRSLQQIMGHAQVTTTEVYTHLSEENLASMHAKFSPAGHRGT